MESFNNKKTEWIGLWEQNEGHNSFSSSFSLKNLRDYKGNVRFILKENPSYEEGLRRPRYLLAIVPSDTARKDLQVESDESDDDADIEYVVRVSDVKRIMKDEIYDVENGVCYADAALAHGMYMLEPYSFYATRTEE